MINSLKTLVLACLTLIATTTTGQNINLRFTGSFTNGDYIRMDSVKVENLNRNWTETLVYPDTVLSFNQTGITDAEGSELELQSYPNPFNGKTTILVTIPQSGNVTMLIHNLAGQKIADFEKNLNEGKHTFGITLKNIEVYLLTITTSNGQKTIKLLNNGSSASNSIIYIGMELAEKRLSSQNFQVGDVLRIAGYASAYGIVIRSREVLQSQTASENFTLYFETANYSLPTVTTTAASNITDSSAVSGGNVTDSGGLAVTARGVCWDTAANPTISDSHTTNGTGVGTFTSNITGLLPNTIYHVRAYATNALGTAYGSDTTFVTYDTVPDGALPCVFSIGANRQVYFSKGNLQWSATGGGSTPTTHAVAGGGTAPGTWRFAEHQWDTIGATNSNTSSSYTGWIDLFGWGTSGYHNPSDQYNTRYQPYDTSTSIVNTDYNYFGYGPSTNMTDPNLTGTSANYDWGVYNAISNGGNQPGLWRTLTQAEWDTLIYIRITSSGIRYAKATVNNVPGLIIVPDNWSTSTYALNITNNYNANVITSAQWATLENAGCAFLPAAGGYRDGSTVYIGGSYGHYWSATHYAHYDSVNAFFLYFGSGNLITFDYTFRYYGISVRLVQDVQ